jgi:hypothetical protein
MSALPLSRFLNPFDFLFTPSYGISVIVRVISLVCVCVWTFLSSVPYNPY